MAVYTDNANRPQDAVGVSFSDDALRVISGIYRRAASVSTTPSDGVFINATVAGTVNLTLSGGGALVVSVPVGSTMLPLSITAASNGTATATYQSLFFQ